MSAASPFNSALALVVLSHIDAWREALRYVKQTHYSRGNYLAEATTDERLKVLDEIEAACRKKELAAPRQAHQTDAICTMRHDANSAGTGSTAVVSGTIERFVIPCRKFDHQPCDSVPGCPNDCPCEWNQNTARSARLAMRFDFESHLARQAAFSERTFGPGARSKGVVDHIRKELAEIEENPGDLEEWIDVTLLALDGAWRTGATPAQIINALVAKQTKNESRTWPDWRSADPDKAIEHDHSRDLPTDDGAA